MRSRDRGWTWILAAALVAVFSMGGSAIPAGAQLLPVAPGKSFSSPPASPSSPGPTNTVFLPLVQSGVAPTVFGAQIYSNPSRVELPKAKQAHVSWMRWPVNWSGIEPENTNPPTYRFSGLDAGASAAQANGVNLLATITGNPSWAATYPGGPIDKVSVSRLADFMGALVERYDGDKFQDAPGSPVVNYWEFYNEPDNASLVHAQNGWGYWGHSGAQYAQMLCTVYPVMKAANPGAKIVLGGMAYERFEPAGPFVQAFLDDVLAAGGGQCLDFINFHYYPYFESVWSSYGPGIIGKATYLRGVLKSHGFESLPMVCTEAGYPSDGVPGIPSTPELQAGMVLKLFTQTLASGLRFTIWWTWSDLVGYDGAFGLVDQSYQPKLSYYGFQTAALQLERAAFQQRLLPAAIGGADAQVYQFRRFDRPFYVLWANGTSSQTVSLSGKSARVSDYRGNLVAVIADGDDGHLDGLVRVTVDTDPYYAEITS